MKILANIPPFLPLTCDESLLLAGSNELYGAPLLVLANKQEVPGALAAMELREHLGLGKFDSRPVDVRPVSATAGDGLRGGVTWIVERAKRSSRAELLRRRAIGR
jgi:ADP-ribosylation factor related protein 1